MAAQALDPELAALVREIMRHPPADPPVWPGAIRVALFAVVNLACWGALLALILAVAALARGVTP